MQKSLSVNEMGMNFQKVLPWSLKGCLPGVFTGLWKLVALGRHVFKSLLMHGNYRSYQIRGRACFLSWYLLNNSYFCIICAVIIDNAFVRASLHRKSQLKSTLWNTSISTFLPNLVRIHTRWITHYSQLSYNGVCCSQETQRATDWAR